MNLPVVPKPSMPIVPMPIMPVLSTISSVKDIVDGFVAIVRNNNDVKIKLAEIDTFLKLNKKQISSYLEKDLKGMAVLQEALPRIINMENSSQEIKSDLIKFIITQLMIIVRTPLIGRRDE